MSKKYKDGIPTSSEETTDDRFVILDDLDPSKKLKFVLDDVSPSTTVNFTVPQSGGTLAKQESVSSEITSRLNADSTLQSNINSVTSNLNSEITSRLNADSTLQLNIDTEITSRLNSDSIIQSNLENTVFFDDYDWTTLGSGTNPHSVVSVTSGTAASNTVQGAATGNDYFGLITLSTGNTATGRAAIDYFNSNNKIRVGAYQATFEGRIRITTLSTSAQSFTAYFGLRDGNAAGLPANGIYFSYTHNTNTGNWRCSCTNSSSTTNLDSSITVVANTWYRLTVNVTGSSVEFFIDDVSIGTITTNIPTSNPMRFMYLIDKSVGTTARTITADYCYYRFFRI